jgi:uncharacterized protein (TIGR02147 family)
MFDKIDYKLILQEKIRDNKGVRGYQKKMSDACQCHTSFISQVANGNLQLTPDHAVRLCKFWGFTELETDYFMATVELARAGSSELQKRTLQKIKSLKTQHQNLSNRLSAKKQQDQFTANSFYYSSWHVIAIHVCCSIEEFQKAESISERLFIPLDMVRQTLHQLVEYGYLHEEKEQFRPTAKVLHLSSDSPLIGLHHQNWRNYVANNLKKTQPTGIHYSSLYAMSKQDFDKLREMTIEHIENTREVVLNSNEEELFAINIDLFEV